MAANPLHLVPVAEPDTTGDPPPPREATESPPRKAGRTAKRNNRTRRNMLAWIEAKENARAAVRSGRRSSLPPRAILELAERERAHPLQLAILYAMWEFSRVETFRLNVHGGIYRPGRDVPGKVTLIRHWKGSIAGLAAWLEVPERTLRYHLKRIDERGRCYVYRLQRGYPAFVNPATGEVIEALPRNSIFQLCRDARHVRKMRASRRETIEGKRTRRRNGNGSQP